MPDDAYTDPDLIMGLYSDPANEVLLAEYAMRTGSIQMGITSAFGGGAAGGLGGAGSVLTVTEIQGQSGGGLPCFRGYTPLTMGDGAIIPLRDAQPGMIGMAFDAQGICKPREILVHHLHGAAEFLRVWFDDGRHTDTNTVHPYWQGGWKFRTIDDGLNEVLHRDGEMWRGSKIAHKEVIKTHEPFLFHNLTMKGLHSYIANGDGVSNRKEEPDGGGGTV